MAADHTIPAAPRLFRVPAPLFTTRNATASTEALAQSKTSSTRDSIHKSRQFPPLSQGPAQPNQGGLGVAPLDANAFLGKEFLKKFSNGLEGFGRPNDAKAPPLGGKGFKNASKPITTPDPASAHQDPMISSLPKPHQYLSASIPTNDSEPVHFEFKKPTPTRSIYTRSSTPARDVDLQDPESHAPVDYSVFQSLMVSQSKKDRLLKEKEEEIFELEQKMQEMNAHNGNLIVELERIKNETKAYVQNCDKLVRSVQKDAQEYQQSSKEAFRKCIDDLKANLPELQGIKNELTEQMQSIETQLEEEHHHCARVGQELLHELEISKHATDFLRDKLMAATSDLAEAKVRVQELEQAAGQDNVALHQALKFLENTRAELTTSRDSTLVAQEDRHLLEEVAQKIKEELDDAMKRAADLQESIRQRDEDAQKSQRELDRLSILLAERTSEIADLKSVTNEIAQTKNMFQAKDKELAVLQQQHAVALKKLAELGENAEQLKDMHHRLEEALCRAAALESQQAEHVAACVGQKERLQQTEQDLKMMEDQYNQTKLRLEKALKEVESLDNRYEDFKAISRGTKQDIIELQTQLANAQEELKASRSNTEFRLEKHSQERKALEQLLELNAQALGKMQEDLLQARAETTQLELQAQSDPEKAQLRAEFKELERRSSADREEQQAVIASLQKELQASIAVTEELRAVVDRYGRQLEDIQHQKELLSIENAKLVQQLTATHSSNQDTLSSLDKIRSERDVAIQLHAQEIAALEDRLNEAERTLAASQADLNQAQHHALMLEDQRTELKRVADAKSLEVQEANKRWELVEKKMEDLAQGFANATSIQNTISTRDAPTLPNENILDPEIVDQLRTEVGLLKEEVEILKERNSELEDLSLTVVERYGSGELTEQEANLVKQVVKSTMHVNQKDLVQKANDLKRREATIQSLEKRVKELEKQLASRLTRKAPTGQLMTMRDIITSSPLSVEEQMAFQQANLFLPLPDHSTMYLNTPSNHQTPSKVTPADIKPTPEQLARPAPAQNRVEIHQHAQSTFARLNHSTSEDDIHQFSDSSPGAEKSAPAHSLRSSTRNNKRVRYEETDIGEDVAVVTRVTRRRKLSGVAERPVVAVSGLRKGTAARNVPRTGQGDNSPNGAAMYRSAQRGKLHR